MFQFSNLSDLEVKKSIRQRMLSDYDFDQDVYFDDIAKIGAFLSSEQLCIEYSKRLNDDLIAYAKRQNVFKTMTKMKLKGSRDSLSTPMGIGKKTINKSINSDDDFGLTAVLHKQYKVLSGYLSEFEAGRGFNKGSYNFESQDKNGGLVNLTTNPNKAVTLPGFAPPKTFRQSLLAKARHFKDPSVGALHGEYTHRLQWCLICSYAESTNMLINSPADIFMACARPVFVGEKTSVWDLVFEGSYGAKDFRTPEAFTEYFLRASRETHPQHKNLWFLAGLVEGRFAKREIEKAKR